MDVANTFLDFLNKISFDVFSINNKFKIDLKLSKSGLLIYN